MRKKKVKLEPVLSDNYTIGNTQKAVVSVPLDIISYFDVSVISKRKLPSSSSEINMVIRNQFLHFMIGLFWTLTKSAIQRD